jgi:hypothetical protein
MDVTQYRIHVAQVFLDNDGWTHMDLLHNQQLTIYRVDKDAPVPDYMNERIALLRLCEINKRERGELHGRRLTEDTILVYLTYDEFNELTSLGVQS